MNYTVAPFKLDEVKAPCTWSVYVDMFNDWRQCLSFNLPLLDDLYSEYLFAKFQAYRDKVHYSGISSMHFKRYYFTLDEFHQYSFNDFLKTGKLKDYTYEQYVSANPNITLSTVQKHPDFAWDYDQLHCFLGENSENCAEIKKCLRQSKFWKRRYEVWSECLSEGNTLLDLCYNKYLEITYFMENDYIFRQILESKFFKVFCENPNVTWDFLKTRVTYNTGVALKKRIVTLISPHVRWLDIIEFCHVNDLFVPSNLRAHYQIITYAVLTKYTNIYTKISVDSPYLLSYKKLRKHVDCDIISALVQKPDVPEEVVMSMKRQFEVDYIIVPDEAGFDTNCRLRKKNNIMPIYLNVNLRNEFKFSSLLKRYYRTYSCENSKSVLNARPLDGLSYQDQSYCDYRIGYSKNINLRLKDINDIKLLHLDLMLFQNPMPLEKVAFLTDVLTPAAIKIQRWYLKHFYRPEGRYVNTVLRNRFANYKIVH